MRRLLRQLATVMTFMSCVFACTAVGQLKQPTPKTIFRDSDGNIVSNNEFVDIRVANFHYPDRTLVKTLEDGTIEFRLQKIPQEGMQSPAFSVTTLDGRTVSSSELKGKVVVLNFWFIGCAVCRAHKPKLNELKTKFADKAEVVFLAMTADPADEVKKYLVKEPFNYLQVTDAKPAMDVFVFSGFPKNIVIDRSGKIVYWRSTIAAWDKFESVIRQELER